MNDSELKGCRVGIELLDGRKIFGVVHNWSDTIIWVIEDGHKKPIDVPRDIIERVLVAFNEVCDDSDDQRKD